MNMLSSLASILHYVERVLDRVSLLFWLLISGTALMLLDHYIVLSLSNITNDVKTALIAAVTVIFCLFLRALKLQRYIIPHISQARSRIKKIIYRRKMNRFAQTIDPEGKNIACKLLSVRCIERRWLIVIMDESESNQQSLLTYGTVKYTDKFRHIQTLLRLGILNRAGLKDSSIVFLHKDMHRTLKNEIARNTTVAVQINEERNLLEAQGRQALYEDLPQFEVELYLRALTRPRRLVQVKC